MQKKILIAYYSYSGNTRALAESIAAKTQGDLFEIVLEKAYPAEYQVVVDQVQKELEYGTWPALKNKLAHIDSILYLWGRRIGGAR
jgi:flavodoxin